MRTRMVTRLSGEAPYVGRYLVVGLAALALHAAVAWSLVLTDTSVLVANALGFAAGWIVSFLGHYTFTFRARVPMRRAFFRFLAITVVLFVASNGIVGLGHSLAVVGDRWLPALGVAIVPCVSYLLSRLLVFAPLRNARS